MEARNDWFRWALHPFCIIGLHRLCPARWIDMPDNVRTTCNCESSKWHKYVHTGTHDDAGQRLNQQPKPKGWFR